MSRTPTRISTHCWTISLVLLLLCVHSSGALAQELEDGLVIVEIGSIVQKHVEVKVVGEERLYLPLTTLADLLQCRIELSDDHTSFTVYLVNDISFTIDPVGHTYQTGALTESYDSTWTLMTETDLYVLDSLLVRATGIAMRYDVETLTLRIDRDERIPVVSLAEARRRWGSATRRKGEDYSSANEGNEIGRDLLGFPALQWENVTGLAGSDRVPIDVTSAFQFQAFVPFFYGRLTTGGEMALPLRRGERVIPTLGQLTWDYTVPGSTILSDVQLSSGAHGGLALSLSNADAQSDGTAPSLTTFDGTAVPGAYVELYREGQLYTVTQADSVTGDYQFTIQVTGGAERCTVKVLGKNGERETNEVVIGSNGVGVRPGTVQYTLNSAIGSFSLASPMSSSFTAGVGIFPWLSLNLQSAVAIPSIGTVGDVRSWIGNVNSSYQAMIWLGGNTNATVAYGQQTRSIRTTFNTIAATIPISFGLNELRLERDSLLTSASAYTNVSGTASVGPVRVGTGVSGSVQDDLLTISGSAFASLGTVSASVSTIRNWRGPDLDHRGAELAAIRNPVGFVTTQGSLNLSFGDIATNVRADYDHVRNTMALLSLGARMRLSERFEWSAFYSVRNRQFDQPQFGLGVRANMSVLDWALTNRYASGAYASGSRVGGVIATSDNGMEFGRTDLLNRSAVILRAYHDRNNNGSHDDGEEEIGYTAGSARTYNAGAESVKTDEEGRIEPVQVEAEVLVDIDQYYHADRDLFPSKRYYVIVLVAGQTRVIDVPYRKGYVVTGSCAIRRVTTAGAPLMTTQGISGLRIWLKDESGDAYQGEMFDDGSVTITGVPEGRYTVEFDVAQLSYRRIVPADPEMTVDITPDMTLLPLIELRPGDNSKGSPRPDGED